MKNKWSYLLWEKPGNWMAWGVSERFKWALQQRARAYQRTDRERETPPAAVAPAVAKKKSQQLSCDQRRRTACC